MPRPIQYDESLRARLLLEAAHAIARDGVDALSMRALAGAAGTSTNAVYSLFGSKAALVSAVTDEADRSFAAAQHAVPVTDNVLVDLRNLGRAYRAWAMANPSLYTVMFGRTPLQSEASREDASDATSGIAPLTRAIERGIAEGRVRSTVPTEIIALSIWSMTHGFVSLELAYGAGSLGEVFDVHLDAIREAWLVHHPR